MNRQTSSRNIDLSRARPAGRRISSSGAASARGASGYGASAQRGGSYGAQQRSPYSVSSPGGASASRGTSRGYHEDSQRAPYHEPQRTQSAARHASSRGRKKKKKKTSVGKTVGITLLCVFCVLALAVGSLWWYVETLFDTGDMGQLTKPKPPSSGQESIIPDEMTGTMNILVLGIDYSTEDAVKRDPIGNTDMIMYFRVDATNHTMMMTQFPRDMFVGDIGGASGRINGIFAHSADTKNRVNTLAQYIMQAFGLPIDNYVTIDMDSLREIVDIFNGIEVYVPVTMEFNGSRLEQGWRNLKGAECEFFLRQRKDTSATPRSDIDRLVNHQYFYSALFRRVRTATVPDIIKLVPVVQNYINTDLNTIELIQLGMTVLQTPSSNITIGRVPVARGELYYNNDVMVCAKSETAAFLNEYLRPASDPLTANDIGTPDWPTRSEVIGAEVRRMGEVDAVGGDAEGAPPDAQRAAQQQAQGDGTQPEE